MRLTIHTDCALTESDLGQLRKALAKLARAADDVPREPDDPILRGIVLAMAPHVDRVHDAIVGNVARVLDRSLD